MKTLLLLSVGIVVSSTLFGEGSGATSTDQELSKSVQETINKNQSRNVSVEVIEGKVTLKGTAENDEDKTEIEKEAREVPGVVSIDNEIVIETNDKDDSATFGKKIEKALKGWVLGKKFDRVKFELNTQKIILKGSVDTADDKAEIEKKLRQFVGNMDIDNQLKIEPRTEEDANDQDTTQNLEKAIKGWLFGKKFENIKFEVNTQKITIHGNVESQSDKEEIEKKVRQVIGDSMQIDNQVTVGPEATKKSEGASGATSPDSDKLIKKVMAAIKGGVFSKGYDTVSFDVNDGKVTLKGIVEDQKDKQEISKRIQKIEGVKEVDNQIEVEPVDAKKEESDSDLKKKIEDTFKGGSLQKAYDKLSIEVNKGKVVLKGLLDKAADKAEVEKLVGKVKGIANIDNQIEVKPEKTIDTKQLDQDLTKKIEEALKGGYFSRAYDSVTFDVNNGKVTLKGIVETPSDVEEVVKRIRKIDGVAQIDNQLKIEAPKVKSEDNDLKLTKQIHDALKGGYFTRGYDTVSFEVNEGKVTLRGRVDKDSDKDEVTRRVSKIEGISEIDNQVKVEKK